MSNFAQGDTRVVLQPNDFARYDASGSAVLDGRRTRPLWFDGRFLAARDLEREQNYFLQRQADLGHAPGFQLLEGLIVSVVSTAGQTNDIVRIGAGQGSTPAGEHVVLPQAVTIHLSQLEVQPNLDVKFGVAKEPGPEPAKRTGLFALALQPVQFTANPITAFPTTIHGARSRHDGDIVEATSLVLVPYPDPPNTRDATKKDATIARQSFLSGNATALSDSLLPLALVSLQGGIIQWLDTYILRREQGVAFTGVRFGLTDPATQHAFLQQYDSQLQTIVNSFARQNLPPRFAATDYFQALPPAGRFPLASISTDDFSQSFFPPQMDVRLSVLPEDEIAALLDDSLSLPPIDLVVDPNAFSNLTVFALIPTPRDGFEALAKPLPPVPLTATLPQVLSQRRPIDLLRFFHGATGSVVAPPVVNNAWRVAVGGQTYGFYVRRRSSAEAVHFDTLPPVATTTTATPTTTSSAPTTTTASPSTTTVAPTTTTTSPTTTTASPTSTTVAPTTTTAAPTTTTAAPTTTTPAPTTTTAAPTTTTAAPTTTTPRPPTTTTPPPTTTTPRPTTTAPRTTRTLRPPTTTEGPGTTPRTTRTIRPLTTRPQ